MGRVKQLIKSDCQDFSFDGGRDRSWSSSWAKLLRLSGIRDKLGWARVLLAR
ncbi:hypothetical protein A2U01_0107287, partial [Trifolium medium]|nr:hypothetical protein [Trifolium medium]